MTGVDRSVAAPVRPGANSRTSSPLSSKAGFAALALGIALAPSIIGAGGYLETVLIMVGIFAVLALSTDLLLGRLGLPSLANGALFAVGAYTVAVLTAIHDVSFWPALAVGIVLSALSGLCFGYITMRASGHYFAVSSLAFAGACVVLLKTWESVTRGAAGIFGISRPADIHLFGTFKIPLSTTQGMYYLVALLLMICLFVVYRLDRNNFGRRMTLIKVDPVLAGALGVDVFKFKLLAFIISAAMAGAAGGFYASYTSYIDPSLASYHTGFMALVYSIVGGSGRLFGPLIGTAVVLGLGEALRITDTLSQLFVGVALIVILLFMRDGLVGTIAGWFSGSQREPHGHGNRGSVDIPVAMANHTVDEASTAVSSTPHDRPAPLLAARNLTKSYGAVKAVDDIDITVGQGEIVGIMGPNGAGKSTLLGMISGTITSSSGEVLLDGRPVTGLKAFRRSRLGIARTFQTNRVLLDSTVHENMLAASLSSSSAARWRGDGQADASDDGDLIARVLRSTELTNKSDVLASALTVEEQRLLGVAMALATRPSVLLLDEPFAGLREAEMPRLRSVLERLKGERLAIVIIEHKLKVLTTLSDYMYVLDQGKVISSGVPGVVLNDPVVIEAYLGSSHADIA